MVQHQHLGQDQNFQQAFIQVYTLSKSEGVY